MSYSKSVFFIPVWFDNFQAFTKKLTKSQSWEPADKALFCPRYLLSYATRIADNSNLFQLFTLKKAFVPKVYMFRDQLGLRNDPEIEDVRFACFSTGVGFLEFWVSYKDMTPEDIANFAYQFKKAAKMCGKDIPDGQLALYDAAVSLLPEKAEAELFFSAAAPFKYECSCFHFLHLDEAPGDSEASRLRLCRLSHSYNTKMEFSVESDYDMLYTSGAGDHWGGSSEGLVNITYDFADSDSDYYLHTLKISHLSVDYYFLYLLLLNQRFSGIRYIQEIAAAFDKTHSQIIRLNKRIVELKTVFSFNVISDDRVFQNVYSRMYSILEIRHLLDDLVDNEDQMQILQNAGSVRAEKVSSIFLLGISLLSLFSALIDASSYFDRFQSLQPFSTVLGLGCVAATMVLCIFWLINRHNKL
ncbi:MAG: hypothetical protein IKA47_10185 [Oscillospiraceae bacterium]|nr:hypothetical protein [Oscillospiraceae bacterium]